MRANVPELEPFTLAARAALRKPLGHGESATHDERAGRRDARPWQLARRIVSTLLPPSFTLIRGGPVIDTA